MLNKNWFIIGSAITLSLSAYAENRHCGQPQRQLTAKTAQIIAGMICTLQANNLTERQARTAQNSENYVHRWNVITTEDSYVIDGVCATSLKNYDGLQRNNRIVHPGFRLQLSLPRFEDLCDFKAKGTITEIRAKDQVDADLGLVEKIQKITKDVIARQYKRTVIVAFRDIGFSDDQYDDIKNRGWGNGEQLHQDSRTGTRVLSSISLGMDPMSIFYGKLSGSSIFEGSQNNSNQMGIGSGRTMSYQQFFKQGPTSNTVSFSDVKAQFMFNRSLEPSLANRDVMTILGSQSELYIRQNGLMNEADNYDDRTDLEKRYQDINSNYDSDKTQSASNVFYGAAGGMFGCTMYKYEGDRNLIARFSAQDCRTQIRSAGF